MVMTLLGRQVPACVAQLLFTDDELGYLGGYARRSGLRGPEHLGAAVRLVAHLGGYRDRKHDPEPGHQIMWQGYNNLTMAGTRDWLGNCPSAGPRSVIRNPLFSSTYGYKAVLGGQLVIVDLSPNHFTRNPEFEPNLVDQPFLGVLIFESGTNRIGRGQELRSECSGLSLAVGQQGA